MFLLRDLFVTRGVPEFIRSDNGHEFKPLRTFVSRFHRSGDIVHRTGQSVAERLRGEFHSRFRDECLACELFWSLAEARQVISTWRDCYNQRRPHSSLGDQTPVENCPTPAVSLNPN